MEHGIYIEKSISIERPIGELFSFWRDLENLPKIMTHLSEVKNLSDKRSLWIAETIGNYSFKWEAEITYEKENELIVWRSLEGAEVPNTGSVHFAELTNGKGTLIRVTLKYDPPGGKIANAFAKMFLKDPASEIEEDLGRFKQFMETEEVATVEGQSSGRIEEKRNESARVAR
jgi:uncharacterized membrane protein